MRLDARVSASARARRIRVLLTDLGLSACGDTRLHNLSGGERRRLALAVQVSAAARVWLEQTACVATRRFAKAASG